MRSFFKKLSHLLNISPLVAGLEINEFELRYALVRDNGSFLLETLKLPSGVVGDGQVRNQEALRKALAELHLRLTRRRKKKISVILNVPDSNVFTKVFNLPFVDEKNLKSAALLNLQMLSPIDFKTAYFDWQKVGEVAFDGEQIEILSAFISREVVNAWSEALRLENFAVAAIEFPSLSLARLIDFKIPRENSEGAILLRLTSSGLSFAIVKDGNLYFHHFVAWPGAELSLAVLEDIIIRETQKIMNFYAGNWQTPVKNFIIVSPAEDFEVKISKIISDNFRLPVRPLKDFLAGYNPQSNFATLSGADPQFARNLNFSTLTDAWLAVFGSALRGLIPRSRDVIVSLASVGTEEEFLQTQVRNFAVIWRNVVLSTLAFLLAVFFLTDRFVASTAESLKKQLANIDVSSKMEEFKELEKQAKSFNDRLEIVKLARQASSDWLPLVLKIREMAGSEITIDRILIQSLDSPISVSARTGNKGAIIDFKNALSKDQRFSEVNLPLNLPPSGEIPFNITFRIRSLDF